MTTPKVNRTATTVRTGFLRKVLVETKTVYARIVLLLLTASLALNGYVLYKTANDLSCHQDCKACLCSK